jgi:hypothetical protein
MTGLAAYRAAHGKEGLKRILRRLEAGKLPKAFTPIALAALLGSMGGGVAGYKGFTRGIDKPGPRRAGPRPLIMGRPPAKTKKASVTLEIQMIRPEDNVLEALEKTAVVREYLGMGLGRAHSLLSKTPGARGIIKRVRAGYKKTSPPIRRTDERIPPDPAVKMRAALKKWRKSGGQA